MQSRQNWGGSSTAHSFGTGVSLLSYTASNKYECPSDGYLYVVCTSTDKGYASIEDAGIAVGVAGGNLTSNIYQMTFVRKGMHVWVGNGTPKYVTFYPLV